jgi:hypothetical protein
MQLLTLKRQDFVHIFCCLVNCSKYCLDPELEPKLFQRWNRNRNKSLRFHSTDRKHWHAKGLWLMVKGTVSRNRFQKFLQKFTEPGLTKGRGWFLNFLGAPMVLLRKSLFIAAHASLLG